MQEIDYAYTVIVDTNGLIRTQIAEPDESVRRKASTFDIYQTSKELVSDIESQLLADRVAKTVLANIQPKDNSAELKAKILDALSDRGIETPSV